MKEIKGWLKINRGWFNKNKIHLVIDVQKLHSMTDHGTKLDKDHLLNQTNTWLQRIVNYVYSEVAYNALAHIPKSKEVKRLHGRK